MGTLSNLKKANQRIIDFRTGAILLQLSCALWLFTASSVHAQREPLTYLAPIQTKSPRATLRSFMEAMDGYREALLQKKQGEQSKVNPKEQLERALRTLNLEDLPSLVRDQKGKEASIYLKETIDRIIVIDYSQIPDADNIKNAFWRLGGTEIVISQVSSGKRTGEYLFSSDTVQRARLFYEKVQHLPYLVNENQGSGYQVPWMERNLPTWAKKSFLGLDGWQWFGLFFAILLGFFVKTLVRFILLLSINFLTRSQTKTRHSFQFIQKITNPMSYLVAIGLWFTSLLVLGFQGTPLTVIVTILKIIFSACLIWLAYQATDHITIYFRRLTSRTESKLDDQLAPLIERSLRIFTIIIGILISIQNLGVNVASLVAGLGLGGLAFALAARDTVSNLFGSLMIIFDRPFQIGDWIKIGDAEGNVEDIGFRSTRIRTFYNSIVSIPNSKVAGDQIDNLGMREYRRDVVYLSITYDTPMEKMEAFLEGIKNTIKANEFTRKDYFHVVFHEYGDSGLIIMVYYFLKVKDWSTELVEKQNIYLEIYRLTKDLKIEFAFPTQSLHIESFPEKKPLRPPKFHNTKKEIMRQIVRDYEKGGKRSQPKGLGIFTPPYQEKEQTPKKN